MELKWILETPLTDVDAGCPIRIAVRAGDILIATEAPRGLSARNVLPGTIATLRREGSVVRAQVDVGVGIEVHITPTAVEALELRAGRHVARDQDPLLPSGSRDMIRAEF